MATCRIIVPLIKGLPRTNKDGETKFYIQYVHRSYKLAHPTSVRVEPEHLNWIKPENLKHPFIDQDNPVNSKNPDFKRLNRKLAKEKSKIQNIAWDLEDKGIDPTVEAVKDALNEVKPDQVPVQENLMVLMDHWIEEYCRKQKNQALNTLKNKRTCYRRLTEYLKEAKIAVLTPDKVTLGFYNDLVKWLRIRQGMNDNGIGGVIKNLVVFLRYVGDTKNITFADLNKFKVLHEDKDIIYLDQEELDQLEQCDYTKIPKDKFDSGFSVKQLEESRDLFIFVSYSGLRVSDLFRLRKHHIKGDAIQMKAHKTGKPIYAPLVPQTRAILKKYDHRLPQMPEQHYNYRIKDACKLAGINTPVEVTKYVNNKKVHTTVEKWELISSHRAVSSFITMVLEKGVPINSISLITGKTKKVIMARYVGGSKKAATRAMKQAFGGLKVSD